VKSGVVPAVLQITPASTIAWDMRGADRQVWAGAFKDTPAYLLSLDR